MDHALSTLAEKVNCKYSRYADDMTFSSNLKIDSKIVTKISEIVRQHGFELNHNKTRFFGKGDQIKVTGLVINEKIQPSRVWRKKVRFILYKLNKQDQISIEDLNRLNGFRGSSLQFDDCIQMKHIIDGIDRIFAKHKFGKNIIYKIPNLPEKLTVNQAITLTLIPVFRTNKEIATELEISESALESRLSAAYKKIGAKNRKEAIEWVHNNTGKLLYALKFEVQKTQ